MPPSVSTKSNTLELGLEEANLLVQTAYDAGVPYDQLIQFLTHAYVPLPWQHRFHAIAREADLPNGPVDIGVGGARGPGKSHCVFAQCAIDDCQRVAGIKGLFLRQTSKSARESFEDLILKVIHQRVPHTYNRSNNTILFPNGSRILLGGFEDEKDIDKYIGIEYDFIAIEELNQLTKDKVEKLKGSLRTSKVNWRPRMYTSFNPGGLGHEFVKETYVTPYRMQTQSRTRFIPSTYRDNPFLNVEYTDYLNTLGGNLGRAWRDGDWDIMEGAFFTQWRYEKHVVEPYAIPDSWSRIRGIDPSGRHGITACFWVAVDLDGNPHVYREHYATGMDADQHAEIIKRLSEGEQYRYTVIDTSAFSKLGLGETIAEVYQRCGVDGLVASNKERVAGWDRVNRYLRWTDTEPPKLRVFSTCLNLIRTMPLQVHDEHKPDDLDSDGEDHAPDALRYLVQSLRDQKSEKPLNEIQKRLAALRAVDEDSDFSYRR